MYHSRRDFLSTVSALAISSVATAQNSATRSDTELTSMSATQLASLIASGTVSSQEAVKAYLKRLEQVNPQLNAVVQFAKKPLEEARSADLKRQRGGPIGPLHGVPFTIKDNIQTAGIVTTCGMPELEGYIPPKDATVVQRLKDAGGILLGKTNVPEFCLFNDTRNKIYGRTVNPHDNSRVTGGSSGGEAAIIASCGSAFGIGTDIGGSIRGPSHYCGIAGIKPTAGIVSDDGILNCFPPANWGWNSTGPMARYVEDLGLVLNVIADRFDSLQTTADVSKLRIAYFASASDNVSPELDGIPVAVRKAAKHFEDIGATVVEDRPECFATANETWWLNMNPDLGTAFQMSRKEYAKLANKDGIVDRYTPIAKLVLQWQELLVKEGRYTDEQRYISGRKLHEFRADMRRFMANYDLILCPPDGRVAPECKDGIDHLPPINEIFQKVVVEGGSFTQAFNITGWPVVCVPISQTNDPLPLPIGIQVVATTGRDQLALQAAQILEAEFGGWRRPKAI